MTFRIVKSFAPALAAAFVIGAAAVPASAAPVQKAVFDGGAAHVTLVDHRDGRWRDHDRGRHWRGRDSNRRHWRGSYYRPHYRPYRPPRYVYTPPAYYYPYDSYYYYGYPRSGYFSFSSPNLGLSFGY